MKNIKISYSVRKPLAWTPFIEEELPFIPGCLQKDESIFNDFGTVRARYFQIIGIDHFGAGSALTYVYFE